MTGLADLHRHLDGSVRESTLFELAAARGRAVPADLKFQPGMGLDAALARFQFILDLIAEPEKVERIAREVCEDAEADGVTTLEIRFAPQLHSGASVGETIDAALSGIAGRAGLILCGLYGEPPAVLDGHVEFARHRPGVVGIDLAGGPASDHSWGLSAYAEPYQQATALGLGTTVHAGEGRPPAEIAAAIIELGANRIGHGTTLLDDPDVAELVAKRGTTIEACPTSNVHTGIIESVADHPLARWLERGIKVCVCPDNTYLSAVTASQELDGAVQALGLGDDERAHMIACGHQARFRR